ncbi:unnamed protein product, partial [marine sediment metagenome]
MSILKSAESWESKVNVVELLLKFQDNHTLSLQEFKTVFLEDKHPQLRIALIDLIAKFYAKDGIYFLKEQYKNCNDGTVRRNLIEVVGKIDLNDSIPFFIEALSDTNIDSKKLAINFLGKTGKKEAVVPLIELLHFRNAELNNLLIDAIVRLGKKGNLDIIYEYFTTEDPNIKREIPVVLGKIGDKQSEDLLISNLKDKNTLVRKNSVKALEKIIELKNIKYLLDLLDDPEIDVRREVIRVLGNVGSKRAVKPLLEVLKEKDIRLRNLARNAVYKILSKSKTYDLLYDVIKGRNIYARKEAIKLVGLLKDYKAIEFLMKTFTSKVASIRRAAYKAILEIVDNKTNDLIISGLEDNSWQVRMYCARILGEIG